MLHCSSLDAGSGLLWAVAVGFRSDHWRSAERALSAFSARSAAARADWSRLASAMRASKPSVACWAGKRGAARLGCAERSGKFGCVVAAQQRTRRQAARLVATEGSLVTHLGQKTLARTVDGAPDAARALAQRAPRYSPAG